MPQAEKNKAGKIMKALKQINVPALLQNFEEAVEKYVKTWAECKDVKLFWDENPTSITQVLDENVSYRKEHHIDKIVCDGEEYELEAAYEFYEIGEGSYITFIIHSFNPIEVRKL